MDTEWLTEANAVLDKYERDPERAWTATDVLATRADGKAGKLNISFLQTMIPSSFVLTKRRTRIL